MCGAMKKICFVIQRYGTEVNGGADQLCLQLAERLLRAHKGEDYSVDVLTTKAIDYITWRNEYEKDFEVINGVNVHRFGVRYERHTWLFNKINKLYLMGILPSFMHDLWLKLQGPYVPDLVKYIHDNKDEYDVFVFITYLYYPIAKGIAEVKEKSILLPLAHDEPYLNLSCIRPIFSQAKGLFYETPEEKELVCSKFKGLSEYYAFGGAGVDLPSQVDASRFKAKYGVSDYIIYAGRIDTGKNCEELFDFFICYKEAHPGDLKLVLLGKNIIEIPDREDIVYPGFVSEEDKFDAFAGAKALVLPSKFESLSIVVLESFSLGRPVLVNEACEVLKGHIERSEGGFTYGNYEEFERNLHTLVSDDALNESMGSKGKEYVDKHYTWDTIIGNLSGLIEVVSGNGRS